MSKKAIVDLIGAPGPSYIGSGDIVSGALAWYGLRAYNAAYATGSNPCIDIVDSSGGNAATINILSTGDLDNSTLNTWIATHGTARIAKVYDQTGNAVHLTTTPSASCVILQSAVGSFPSIRISAAAGQLVNVTGLSARAQPFVISYAAKANSISTFSNIMSNGAGTIQTGYGNASGNAFIYAGSPQTAAAIVNTFHAIQNTYSGAASELYVDGSGTTLSPGTAGCGGKIALGTDGGLGNSLNGSILEAGIWGATFTSGNKSSMNSNQHTYWGF